MALFSNSLNFVENSPGSFGMIGPAVYEILGDPNRLFYKYMYTIDIVFFRIENNTSEADRELLLEATSVKYNATLLPIRTVGVQVHFIERLLYR